MATMHLPISDPTVLNQFKGPDKTGELRIVCWNAQRIGLGSDAEKKWAVAEDLQLVEDINAVILLEGVQSEAAKKDNPPHGFEFVDPIVGSTHSRKLRTLVWHNEQPWNWQEIDTIGLAHLDNPSFFSNPSLDAPAELDFSDEDRDDEDSDDEDESVPGDEEGSEAADEEALDEEKVKVAPLAAYKVAAAKIRRPTVAVAKIGGTLWGLAALHAPAGGENNKVNLAVLRATVWFLRKYFKDTNWALFGDLNRKPEDIEDLAAITDGAVHTHSNKKKTGKKPQKPIEPKARSQRKGILEKRMAEYERQMVLWKKRCKRWEKRALKFSVLDYALCHKSVKARVKVEVLQQDWPETPDIASIDAWVSDHRPILVTITPPPAPPGAAVAASSSSARGHPTSDRSEVKRAKT